MPTGVYQRKKQRGKYKKKAAKPEAVPREPKEKAKPEMFAVQITVPDSQLGQLLRCASSLKGAQVNGVLPIEERARERNLPKGSFKEAIIEIVTKNGGDLTMSELKAHLIGMGFGNNRVHSGVADAIRNKGLKKDGNNILSLGKWK